MLTHGLAVALLQVRTACPKYKSANHQWLVTLHPSLGECRLSLICTACYLLTETGTCLVKWLIRMVRSVRIDLFHPRSTTLSFRRDIDAMVCLFYSTSYIADYSAVSAAICDVNGLFDSPTSRASNGCSRKYPRRLPAYM